MYIYIDTQYFFLLGIAIHQITTIVDGIRIYLKVKINRNKEISNQDDCPGTLIEAQESTQNEQAGTLNIDINKLNEKMNEFKAEIIEALRKDMAKGEK